MDSVIEVKELSKSFGRGSNVHRALDDVSLSVQPGEMVALIGASGSGKSTLMRLISGLAAADRGPGQGLISVHGRVVQRGGRVCRGAGFERANTSVIFQQFNLVGRLSVLTNVCLGLLGRISPWRGGVGWFTRLEKYRAMEALERVDMVGYAAQRASTLSGGQQQRVAIARALVQGANLILADEPIASLDPAASRRVMQNLSDINASGISIVVSLHQVVYARKYCRRTIAMRDGRLVFDGPSTDLVPEFLHELYGDNSEELELSGHGAVPEPMINLARASCDIEHGALGSIG